MGSVYKTVRLDYEAWQEVRAALMHRGIELDRVWMDKETPESVREPARTRSHRVSVVQGHIESQLDGQEWKP